MAEDPEGAGVRGAAERTVAAGSARLAYGLQVGAPEGGEWDRSGEGLVDFAGRRARVSEQPLPGPLRQNLPSAPEGLTRPRDVLYDGANQLVLSGDTWFAFTAGDRDGPRGHQDPVWLLDALYGAHDDAVEAGTATLRGVATRHVRLTVDLVAADELLPAGMAMPEGPLRRLRQLRTEVWLDEDGLARQIAVQNASGDRRYWRVTEFWDFGVAVAITAPDPELIKMPGPADWQRIFLGEGQ